MFIKTPISNGEFSSLLKKKTKEVGLVDIAIHISADIKYLAYAIRPY